MVKQVAIEEEGKTIALNKMPDCSHKNSLIDLVMDKSCRICIVAVSNKDKTWQAYAGFPDQRELKSILPINANFQIEWLCEFVHDRAAVIMMGEKLPEKVARQLFPEWEDKKYKNDKKKRSK